MERGEGPPPPPAGAGAAPNFQESAGRGEPLAIIGGAPAAGQGPLPVRTVSGGSQPRQPDALGTAGLATGPPHQALAAGGPHHAVLVPGPNPTGPWQLRPVLDHDAPAGSVAQQVTADYVAQLGKSTAALAASNAGAPRAAAGSSAQRAWGAWAVRRGAKTDGM